MGNKISKAKKALKKFLYEENTESEEKEKSSSNKKWSNYIYFIVMFMIFGLIVSNHIINKKEDSKPIPSADFLEEKLEGDISTISSGELSRYMIDSANDCYIKTAMTKIGGRVAYSLTYRYDLIPTGQVATDNYFTAGSMTSILLNGYPNKSYKEMGLNNDEEAYIATQLAVYEFVSQMQYEDIANGEFSIDDITASEQRYVDMVERVKEKAMELLNYALENPFEEDLTATMDTPDDEINLKNNTAIIGPYCIETDTDETTKRLMGNEYKPTVEVDLKSYIDNTSAVVTDKDGNKLENVDNGENFYIKISGSDKIFSQFKLNAKTYALRAKIYENNENKKKYVALEPAEKSYADITSIIYNIDSADIDINFKNYDGEILSGIKYYIYDENDQFIQDIDESAGIYDFNLPVGKYYIKIYEIPDGYFIDGEKFEFEVEENKENVLDIPVDSL